LKIRAIEYKILWTYLCIKLHNRVRRVCDILLVFHKEKHDDNRL
jgi:hypothetical protein